MRVVATGKPVRSTVAAAGSLAQMVWRADIGF